MLLAATQWRSGLPPRQWPPEGQRSVTQAISPTAFLPLLFSKKLRINKSPLSLEDPEKGFLKKMLTTPPVKKIDLHFPLGLEVTARNMKGVTIKDALDAIYKQYRKKADDELENPVLAGFEWDKEESWTRLVVHCKKEGAPPPKKSKKKADKEGES
ncbi:WD repeat containing 44 protein [Rutstroemia sp. NJR-2017a BVV2]|nr:WD repeat containing 44 protein [Rutstroemia sp. NJR-2017a BVV2]